MSLLKKIKQKLQTRFSGHEPDKNLIWAVFVMIVFGLVMLYSASSVVSYSKFGNTYHYFIRQFIAVLIGLASFYVISRIDYHVYKKWAIFFLFSSIFLLLVVFIPGLRSDYGTARSWISIFGLSFQPSELVKLSFLIYLATWLEVKNNQLNNFSNGVFPFIVILSVVSLLMMAQPDMGTLFIIIFMSATVFFVGGGKMIHILVAVLLAVCALLIFLKFNTSYQMDRFKCLEDPNFSAQDKCYQINQSLIAVGSGGWFGRGIGQSRQKFMYLPEVWGDSIFPIISEELGFIFSTLLILLFLFIFWRGLLIARDAPDIYGRALATGIVAWLSVQSFLNIGGMINLIPMTGVPLPFISSGGSAMLSAMIGIAILVNISRQTKTSYRRR
jgi:cell division protein FtsW